MTPSNSHSAAPSERLPPANACAALEVALNRYLGLEPDVLKECARLDQKILALQVPITQWVFWLEFHRGGVRVMPPQNGEKAHAKISGSLSAFMQLADAQISGNNTFPSGISVSGDADLLARFQKMIADVGFDLGEILQPMLGAASAQRAATALKSFFGWGKSSSQNLVDNTAEYLREESRDVVSQFEAEEWISSVDSLRDDVDRLEARVRLIERRKKSAASANAGATE